MIVDTSILVAAADRRDASHERAVAVLQSDEGMVVSEPVVVETAWYIERRMDVGVEAVFLRALDEGPLVVEDVTPADRNRAAELITVYEDARLGYVDAVTMAIAERLGERRIATLDRRDFSLVRPRHVEAFEIVP